MSSTVQANLEAVNKQIHAAALRAGRNAGEITLVAVTKTHPLETVIEAYQAGLRHFGENRVLDGKEKVQAMAQWLASQPDVDQPQWHFIGHIQSRQVAEVLEGSYHLLHSVDSLKLAQRLNRLAQQGNYPPVSVLLQCNVSGESTKSGFALTGWNKDNNILAAFVETTAEIARLNKIVICGLMTMAPWSDNPETARPTFKSLAALRHKLKKELPSINWHHLSMGMTDDFEIAIEEGATIIRVGRALFGERNYT